MEKLIINSELTNIRLDKALTTILEGKSRSYISKMIEEDKVLVNGKIEKQSYKLRENDVLEYELLDEKPMDITGQDLNLEIVYEDEDVAVVNKPKGMVVHPACGNYENTLSV